MEHDIGIAAALSSARCLSCQCLASSTIAWRGMYNISNTIRQQDPDSVHASTPSHGSCKTVAYDTAEVVELPHNPAEAVELPHKPQPC